MRLSKPGQLEEALTAAGSSDVHVTEVDLYDFGQDPKSYFDMLYDTAPMFRSTFDGLNEAQQRRVRERIQTRVADYEDNGVVRVPAVARVGSGMRSAD